jgi:hypothetical protein
MSRVYPERKWIKERMHHTKKPNRNRVLQPLPLARSITKGKPDIRGSGEQENAPQRKIDKIDGGFSSIKYFQMKGQSRRDAKNHERSMAHDENTRYHWRAKDGYVEGHKISGGAAGAPALPIDIIMPHFELFSFSGQGCKF